MLVIWRTSFPSSPGVSHRSPTPLLKLDLRALDGYRKKPIPDDHRQRIGGSWTADETAGVDFVCPELVAIAPEFITAYITEAGILPPTAMYTAG